MSKVSYEILGLSEDADEVVVRAAYKALAQKYHPDKWAGDKQFASSRMAEINSAYDNLSTKDYSSQKRDEMNTQSSFSDKQEVSDSNSNGLHLLITMVSIITLLLVAFISAKG